MSIMHMLSCMWMVPAVASAPVLWMTDFTLKGRRSARRSSACSWGGVLGQCCVQTRTLSGTTGRRYKPTIQEFINTIRISTRDRAAFDKDSVALAKGQSGLAAVEDGGGSSRAKAPSRGT